MISATAAISLSRPMKLVKGSPARRTTAIR
jgi:hypothetical protein